MNPFRHAQARAVRAEDFAPTMAVLLGVELPNVDGRALLPA